MWQWLSDYHHIVVASLSQAQSLIWTQLGRGKIIEENKKATSWRK
jgi:hypothetical protein